MVSIDTLGEDNRLWISALAHYAERLRKALYDKDIIIVDNECLKLDLIRESTLAEQLRLWIEEKGIIKDPKTGSSIFEDSDYKKIMADALDFYKNDLELSKTNTIKKLGYDFSKFNLVDKEIRDCDSFKGKLSKL